MPDWTPERQATVFADAYTKSRGVYPSMGGRMVGGFHGQVVATAKAQDQDPEKLFRKHLATWLKERVTQAALRAPYAFFQSAWGELADRGPAPVQERPAASAAESREERAGRRAELLGQLSVLEGECAIHRGMGRLREVISTAVKMEEIKAQLRALKGGG